MISIPQHSSIVSSHGPAFLVLVLTATDKVSGSLGLEACVTMVALKDLDKMQYGHREIGPTRGTC